MLARYHLADKRCIVAQSTVSDVYRLAANMRPDDMAEVKAMGIEPRSGLRAGFRDAILRRTYFVDGEIAAMSGVCGPMLSDIGEPYLLTTSAAEKVPVLFVKYAKTAVEEMMRHKLRLEGHVAASYVKACRLLQILGFTLGKPLPFGPEKALFRTFTMMREP